MNDLAFTLSQQFGMLLFWGFWALVMIKGINARDKRDKKAEPGQLYG